MRTLVMTFLTAEGKKASIKIKDVKDTLDALSVGTLMDTIINKNIFSASSGDLVSKDSAEVVVTQTEALTI